MGQYHIKADVVVPLVAIATARYVPTRCGCSAVQANLEIVRLCLKYRKRLVFPSTSEIYGMSTDSVLHEKPVHWCTDDPAPPLIYAHQAALDR